MKKIIKSLLLSFSGFFLTIFLFCIFLLFASNLSSVSRSSETVDGIEYVEHWTTDDPYTHNLLAHRYGITAEQIDGYLATTGINYDKSRINGKLLLTWEKSSGLDVRAIVAIAIMESSLGTAGVATKAGANMFGYGAYDSNPDHATNFNDESAVTGLTTVTIIQNKNTTFKIQDEKAKLHSLGLLNVTLQGGVYFTDTSGSGKKRAEVMERMDSYIDAHGGTPKPPKTTTGEFALGSGTIASSWDFPVEYTGKLKYNQPTQRAMTTQAGSGYPVGQCTWYVYNRLTEIGMITEADGYGYLGNGQDWVGSLMARGWKRIDRPVAGAVVSMAYGEYGHVAFIEHVNEDGSFLLSECNYAGNQSQVHFQVTTHQANFSYAIRK